MLPERAPACLQSCRAARPLSATHATGPPRPQVQLTSRHPMPAVAGARGSWSPPKIAGDRMACTESKARERGGNERWGRPPLIAVSRGSRHSFRRNRPKKEHPTWPKTVAPQCPAVTFKCNENAKCAKENKRQRRHWRWPTACPHMACAPQAPHWNWGALLCRRMPKDSYGAHQPHSD